MQISSENESMKDLKIQGRLVSFRVQSDLRMQRILWIGLHRSSSLICVPKE